MISILEAECNYPVKQGSKLIRPHGVSNGIIAQYLSHLCLSIDGVPMNAVRGDILIVLPNTPHEYQCPEDLSHHWIHVDGDLQSLLDKFGLSANSLYHLENWEELSYIFCQVAIAWSDNNSFRETYVRLKTEELLVNIAMQLELQRNPAKIDTRLIMRFKKLRGEMIEHPERPWNIHDMAEKVYFSESYFYQMYRQVFGITPTRDLIEIRLGRSRTLLRDGYAVSIVSELSGYENVSHFIRQFKKNTGLCPGEYARNLRDSYDPL